MAEIEYEMIGRIWRDATSTSEDSVYVEIVDDEVQITSLTDADATSVRLDARKVRELRNALARAEKRVG